MSSINFKVFPVPQESRSFEMRFATAAEAFAERDRILQSVLQPTAIDIVNWPSGFRLLVRAGGNAKVLDRYARELAGAVVDESVWEEVREFTPRFLAQSPEHFVLPIPLKFTEMTKKVEELKVPVIVRAGSGVIYAHLSKRTQIELPGDLLVPNWAMMTKVKEMFDPEHLLNRGRLYGRL
jgi:glycolate oxidase FAD binding subunit